MYRIRGKTAKGQSVTGVSGSDTFAGAATEAEESAESAGDELVHLSIKPLDESAGIKVGAPRKRDGGETAGNGGKKGGRKRAGG